jgi:hypothetical protein
MRRDSGKGDGADVELVHTRMDGKETKKDGTNVLRFVPGGQ